jgi:Fe-S oxidoreductase
MSPEAVADLPWACTGCGACEDACLHDNEVPFWLLFARQRVRDAGRAPAAAVEAAACFGVAGNAFGVSLEPALRDVLAQVEGRPLRLARDLYLPGCVTLHARPGVAVAFLALARSRGLGEVAATAASAHCCGAPLAWAGELEGFAAHAARYAPELEPARRVIVHDPVCAHALRVLYPRLGVRVRPEILTLSAFLRTCVLPPVETGAQERHAFLEPCHLGRRLGEVEGTRGLLDRLLGARWAPLADEDCCGAAGLLPETRPRTARQLAEARLRTFWASGADRLLTASPRCAAHLASVDPQAPIADVSQLLEVSAP